jgi:hypothetical protein
MNRFVPHRVATPRKPTGVPGPEKGFHGTHGIVSNSTVMSLLHYDSILACNPLASGTEGPPVARPFLAQAPDPKVEQVRQGPRSLYDEQGLKSLVRL